MSYALFKCCNFGGRDKPKYTIENLYLIIENTNTENGKRFY